MPVEPDAPPEGAAEEEVHSEAAGEVTRVVGALVLVRLGRVELLERDEVGLHFSAYSRDVERRVASAATDASMHVVRHGA